MASTGTIGTSDNRDPVAVAALLRNRTRRDGILRVPARGRSMGRRYSAGTSLYVVERNRQPRVGEVWVFVDADAQVIAHRCWGRVRRADGWRFRGDARLRWDPAVRGEQLVGPVAQFETHSGLREPRMLDVIPATVEAALSALRRRMSRVCVLAFRRIVGRR